MTISTGTDSVRRAGQAFPEPAMTDGIREKLPAYTASIGHTQNSPKHP
ncbi:hypothetical protein ACIQTZ_17950 [Paenarthrobacter sp. NPDC090520]